MEGPASTSRKRTTMNVVVHFPHFFVHSIETDAHPPNISKHEPYPYSFYPTDCPRALCQHTLTIRRIAPERSSPLLRDVGLTTCHTRLSTTPSNHSGPYHRRTPDDDYKSATTMPPCDDDNPYPKRHRSE